MVLNNLPVTIDGTSEYTITHLKKRIILDFLAFLFWSIIGTFFIVLGSVLSNESLFLRIVAIVAGSLVVVIFFESFLTKVTNKIVLNNEGIKTRNFLFWESLTWESISSLEIEKKTVQIFNKKSANRITILKINSPNKTILYPLYRFSIAEAENILEIVKFYYKTNLGKELQEVIINETKSDPSEELTEEAINSQIPPRVLLEDEE